MTRPADNTKARRWTPADIAPLASLAVLVTFFALATEFDFLKTATLVQVLKQGAVLAIVAAGLTFVLLAGEIDLGVGMLALWTACFCGWLYQPFLAAAEEAGLAPGAAAVLYVLAVPLASTLGLGLASGSLTVWARLPSFIITLAMMNIADGAARWLTQSETFPVPNLLKVVGNRGVEEIDFFGWTTWALPFTLPYSALLAAAVFAVGHVTLVHTRFGRYVYMTGGNREAARLAGVRTGLIVVGCLAISSVTAGIGGLVNAGRLGNVSLDQNADLLLSAVACVVLGGTSLFGGEGSMGKTVIGVVTFSVLKVGLNQITWINDLARPLLMGAVLLVALVVNGVLARRR
jgi:ribose transport system permease protein